MASAQKDRSSLRLSRAETARLVVALLLSVLIHLVLYAGYHTGNKEGWWQKWHPPSWLHLKEKQFAMQAQATPNEEPSIFVDVSHADADAPQAARYYSDRNSRAANPNPASTTVPRIEGRQKVMPKTEDVPKAVKAANPTPAQESAKENNPETHQEKSEEKTKADRVPELAKLEPSLPPPSLAPIDPADTPPAPLTPGETALRPKRIVANPAPAATPAAQPVRPRTIRQALAQRDQLPGQQMQQAGGVARHAMTSSLDVKSTPFGDYDRAIVEAVSQRWYDLLDSRRFSDDRTGKVILRFKLKPDGSIIEMQTLENTVGELLGYLCQEAIEEAAPFAKWPPDMARMIGANTRDITFTFYYY
jgi:hypothetical protein